jgi:HK97 family phage portal protein
VKLADWMPWRRKSQSVYDRLLDLLERGSLSRSGQAVTRQKAFRVSAALACMRVLSQGCAQTPFKLYREQMKDGLRRIQPARDHQVYDLVATRPNAWQTSFEFRETMVLHACMGNAYAFKSYYRGQPAELILLNPMRVKAEQDDDWSVKYRVTGKDGTQKTFDQGRIWHVRGPSWDGFLGMDTLDLARESLGLALALEDSHSRLHANGVRPSGTYSVEGTLDKEQHTNLVKWLKTQAGSDSGAPMVLDRGAKWLNTAMTGVDAQHKEVRDLQVEEVCRFFGVLPIMIGHTGSKGENYASAEAKFTAHKVHSLDPWFARIQASADLNLLSEEERRAGFYFKFNANGLLRGSSKDRGEYYSKALGAGGAPGWMTQDEVRELEELDPKGGDAANLPVATNVPGPAPAPDPDDPPANP